MYIYICLNYIRNKK